MPIALQAFNAPYATDDTQTRIYLHGQLVITTQTYTVGGILPSYTNIKDASGQVVVLATLNINPDTMWLQTNTGSGFVYNYIKSTGKIMIQGANGTPAANAPATVELTAVTLPAGVLGDVVEFEAEWVRQ